MMVSYEKDSFGWASTAIMLVGFVLSGKFITIKILSIAIVVSSFIKPGRGIVANDFTFMKDTIKILVNNGTVWMDECWSR